MNTPTNGLTGTGCLIKFTEDGPDFMLVGNDAATLKQALDSGLAPISAGKFRLVVAYPSIYLPLPDPGIAELQELAAKLDGRETGNETTKELEAEAKEKGFIIVFGYSDDCTEFRGAMFEESSGGTTYFSKSGKIFDEGALNAIDKLVADGTMARPHVNQIEAVWGKEMPDGRKPSWHYKLTMPHAEFRILEDGELYCVGVVFRKSDLK